MRYKGPRLSEIIRNTYHRDPLNGDVYIYFSRDMRTIRLFQYKHHAFDLHERTFNNEYRFKQVVLRDGVPTYKMDWKTVAIVLESPVEGMNEQELHNFCRFLYSQLQTKDDEIKRLSSNVQELTQEVRLARLQQQSANDEHMAANTSTSEKLDSILTELTATKHQLVETQRELADTNILLASEREEKQKLKEEKRQYEKERCDLLEEISSLSSS